MKNYRDDRTMKTGKVTIIGYSRLHFGLLDLGRATGRAYGGLGTAIAGQETVVESERRDDGRITIGGVSQERGALVRQLIVSAGFGEATQRGLELTVSRVPTQHIGLGSETTLRLACLVAARSSYGLATEERQFQSWSHRGGTSGVGIHSFFHGGLIVDAGRPAADVKSLLPSSAATSIPNLPLLQIKRPMPEDWSVALILPGSGVRTSGYIERAFFQQHTPIRESEVYVSIGLVYHGLVPAVAAGDFCAFKRSLIKLQKTGFKRIEIARHSPNVVHLIDFLNELDGLAAGMSSMGPLVFAISQWSVEQTEEVISRTMRELGSGYGQTSDELLGVYNFRNSGYSVE